MKMGENGKTSRPLLTDIRDGLTDDLHEKIMQKMVEGDVADRDLVQKYVADNT